MIIGWKKTLEEYGGEWIGYENRETKKQAEEECPKCKELNEKWGNEHYVAYCDECLDKRLDKKFVEQEDIIYALQETLRQEQMVSQKYEKALREIIKRSDSMIPYQIAKQTLEK